MKLSSVLDKFLLEQKVIGNSGETIQYYRKRIGYFITFLNDKDVDKLCIDDYNNYANYLIDKKNFQGRKLSSATIKTTLNASKIFIKYCCNKKYVKSDFYKEIHPYKQVKKAIVVLSQKEIAELLNSQDEFSVIGLRNLLAISLMLDAGLRLSEVCNLDVPDINKMLGLIRVFRKRS